VLIQGSSPQNEKRREIFEDTLRHCDKSEQLKDAIRQSVEQQFVILEGPMIDDGSSSSHRYDKKASVIVSTKRSYEAAGAYLHQNKKICVLNFANAFHPGGGVKEGCSAQEESLCRCSTLYQCISAKRVKHDYHDKHKNLRLKGDYSNLANNDCIYTPGVVVFKSDVPEPELLPEEEWYKTDVITCAAPDLRGKRNMPDEKLQSIHEKRGRRILEIAKRQKVDVLILGAFGCGAFENRPETVVCAYKKILKEYVYDFDTVEFAVAGKAENNRNYEVFKIVLEDL
jgi:uncharacterized protein (TIGR02452 family)